MASNYRIVSHEEGKDWAVLSKSGLFYPDNITVEVKDHGMILGEWTLNQIVEGFKESLHPTPINTNRCDSHHKLHENLDSKIDCTWKAISEVDSRMNGQVTQIASLENEINNLKQTIECLKNNSGDLKKIVDGNWKHTQERISFHHSELVRLNMVFSKHIHNTKPGSIFNNYTGSPTTRNDETG
jgi:predicted RNase H-like nuclease (RuvC/YqgF family)